MHDYKNAWFDARRGRYEEAEAAAVRFLHVPLRKWSHAFQDLAQVWKPAPRTDQVIILQLQPKRVCLMTGNRTRE